MRELIEAVKNGEPVLNRDVTGLDQDARMAVLNELRSANPDPEASWFWHTCREEGCSREAIVFTEPPIEAIVDTVQDRRALPLKLKVVPKKRRK